MGSEQVRFFEELRDIYKDKTIWIIGTGASLDDFPSDFFDDKITIAVNLGIAYFNNATYCFGNVPNFLAYLKKNTNFLEKAIIPYTGRVSVTGMFGELTSLPVWMKVIDSQSPPKAAIEITVKGVIEKNPNTRYYGCQSVAHTAIEAAAVMGAKKIVLAGCEHAIFGGGNGRPKKSNVRLLPGYRIDPRVPRGTKWLAELFGKHGIEIIRYYNADTEYYKKGYEEIKPEEEVCQTNTC